MDALFGVLNMPGLLLHVQKLPLHPRMALAGMLANSTVIWQLSSVENDNEMAKLVYKLSVAEFIYQFHAVFLQARKAQDLRLVIFFSIVLCRESFSNWLLYMYAVYVSSFAPCFIFHLYYIFFHGIFQLIEQLRILVHVSMFFLMVSAYQIADICDFIREVELDAA